MKQEELASRSTANGHRPLLARIPAAIDWFVPTRVRNDDVNALRRARLVVMFDWALIALGVLYAFLLFSMNSPIAAAALGAGAVVGVAVLFVMRRTGSCCLAGNLTASAFYGALIVVAFRLGGHGAHVLAWCAAVPVVALSTAGRRSAVLWLGLATSALTAFYVLDYGGYRFAADLTPAHYEFLGLLSWIGLTVLILGLALVYDLAMNRTLAELRSAEDQLLKERDFSDSAITALPGIFYVFNAEGRFVRWNENFALVCGLSDDEIRAMHPLDLFRGRDKALVKDRIEEVFTVGQTTVEASLVTKDGTEVPHLFTGKRVMIDGALHLVGLGMDITERKRTEEALEKRVLALTRPLVDGDNIALEELFNLEEIQRLQDEFADACGVASIITRLDGTPITAPSNFSRLCRDIIRNTPQGCANCVKSDAQLGQFRPDGPVIQPCLSVGLWGAGTSISVGGRHIANWLIGQVRDESQSAEKVREYARTIGADEEATVKAFYEVPAMSRDRFGRVAGALFTIARQLSATAYQNVQQARFIAERKQAEAELATARDVAEAATRAKSEFLANMSHEIRTPMTAILGFSEILIGSVGDPQQLEAAATIRQNGEYLLGILNDILDLSKIEAGRLDVDRVPCSPCQILSKVVTLMRVRADAKNLPLHVEYDGPIPETIRSDPTRLRQILINLVGNAIKFTEVGEVRLIARLSDARSNRPRLQIDVVDSGIGLNEEQILRLFKPFSQVDASTTRRYGGTGLGLTVSKRLASELGGDITVRSTSGKGSTFTVTIGTGPLDGVALIDKPNGSLPPTSRDDESAAPQARLDCRVLLAEDGPDNQRLIAFMLEKAGAEVVVAENGQMACEIALAESRRGAPFDIILMDMQMPVMDGYLATRCLRQEGYQGPIIALTAHAMIHDRQKCVDAGCNDYASKPIDQARLLAVLTAHLPSAAAAKPLGER